MIDHILTVQNLTVSYGSLKAVDNISFEISRGETFGLLGPNGAGKTSTLHAVTGVLKPDDGKILLDGDEDPTRPGTRRKLGTTPQNLSLYEELTGRENLLFFGKLYGLKGARLKEKVEWALDFAGLSERAGDRVSAYSGGMKRRLNLVAAMLHDPPVILMDEPTVGVDPQSRNLLFDNIEKLKGEGRTILYTTHYMEEAQRLCDRVAIMDHGAILALDTVDRLIETHGGASVVEMELREPMEDPSLLPGAVLQDSILRLETDRPLETVAQIGKLGLSFLNMKVHRSDLETVFLNLTGRRLRD